MSNDIVHRLRSTRRCTQFDSAGRLVEFDGYPSDAEKEAAREIERLQRIEKALIAIMAAHGPGTLASDELFAQAVEALEAH